jgi:hypothetical protein
MLANKQYRCADGRDGEPAEKARPLQAASADTDFKVSHYPLSASVDAMQKYLKHDRTVAVIN